ncbi:DNA-binding domain-containing protein [Cerasicoccus maritimus]|uniref:DNA-binding domain-containing protein n=1 Tax=Cerasicoccus maritimus TaxID=490089 RepID=UPI002852D943|nr:DNA-binding domain-containing protein [Cerasicoccus maritimus]
MSIKYKLLPNALTNDGSYAASMRLGDPFDLEAIIADMDERGTTVAESETRAVLIEFLRVIKRQVLAGKRVNLGGLVRLFPSIRGVFLGPDDAYDESRHELVLHAVADRSLLNGLRDAAEVEKLTEPGVLPILQRLYDHGSTTYDNILSPANTATLKGDLLNYNAVRADEGLFLINLTDQTETRVEQVPHNVPKELLFLVPADLPAATSFALELRKRFTPTGALRASRLEATLATA